MPINSSAAATPTSKTRGALLFSSSMIGSHSFTALSAKRKTQDQRFRRAGAFHAFLNGGNIVGCAPELHPAFFKVGNGKGRARIAIAGLARRSGVQEIARLSLQIDADQGPGRPRRYLDPLDARPIIRETTLNVRVPEETHGPAGGAQTGQRLLGSEDVFVFVFEGAMDEHHTVCFHRATGQGLQITEIFRTKLSATPFHRRASHGIEIVEIGDAAYRFIVIAANNRAHKSADAFHDFIPSGSVTHDVAKAHGPIPTPRAGLQRRFERGRVRVHITEDQQTHVKTAETAAEE